MPAIYDLNAFYENIKKASGEIYSEPGYFDILKIEDLALSNDRKPLFVRRSFFKVTLITGKNRLHFDENIIEFDGTALVFTNPAIPYFWERLSNIQIGYMCIFTSSFFTRFGSIMDFPIFQFKDAAVVPLQGENITLFNGLFENMFQEIKGTYSYRYDLLRHKLAEIFHEAQKIQAIAGLFTENSTVSVYRISMQFTELLQRQFPIELKYQIIKLRYPVDFAREMRMHVNHLNKALKEVTGQNTAQLINDRIVGEAQALLLQTSWSIAEIAYSLGFHEPNNFSAFFKSRTKVTPKNFRMHIAD